MAAENVDLGELVKTIQDTFGHQCRCANLPGADKNSVVDCIANDSGDSPLTDVAQAHTDLIESVIEADDALMERYLGGEEISADEVASAPSPAGVGARPSRETIQATAPARIGISRKIKNGRLSPIQRRR